MSDRSHAERRLLLSVSRSVAEAPSLEAGLQNALEDVCTWTDWVVGQAWVPTEEGHVERLPASYGDSDEFVAFNEASTEFTFAPGEGIPGRVLESADLVWFPDVSAVSRETYPRTGHAADVGLKAGLGVPVIADGEVAVILEFYLSERREVDDQVVDIVSSVAAELGALVARKQAEDALDRERDLLDQVLEAAPVAISVLTPDGRVERANARALELRGLARAGTDRLGSEEHRLLDEAGDPIDLSTERPFVQVLETGEPLYDWTAQVEMADGERKWISVNATPIFDDDGTIARVVTATEDITQLKEQARHLERQRDDLRAELDEVFARIDDAVYALDTEWRFTYVNDRAAELLGHPREELVRESIWEAVPEAADDQVVQESFQAAMETQEPVRYERYSESLEIWIEATVYPSETGVSVYFRDVTDRKERERQLEQYRALTQAANDVIVIIDGESTIQSVNDAVTDIFGYDPEALIGESLTVLMPEELKAQHREAIARYLETGERTLDWDYLELPGRHADGSEVPLAVSFSEVGFEGAKYFIGVIRDITERKAIERELEESNERLEQFAYIASHDLREPLRMVSSYLQLVENRSKDDLDEETQEYIQYAVDGADRMRAMIESLLEYSRITTRGEPPEPTDVEELLDGVLDDLGKQIAETDATITAAELPTVVADSEQLAQVFLNLISNALKYSGDQQPKVHIDVEREDGMWVFSVADEGIGISPDEHEHVFELFETAHSAEEGSASGIGLALCEQIVDRHGGDIWVESEPGEGATFSFTVPVHEQEKEATVMSPRLENGSGPDRIEPEERSRD